MHPAAVRGGDGGSLESAGKRFSGTALKIALLIVTCTLLLNQFIYDPIHIFHNSSSTNISSEINCHDTERDENPELEEILSKAAIKNRTVIITTLNAAWTEPNSIFDLFLESFRIGDGTAELLSHVVVAAFDKTAYKRCSAEGLHCYAVATEGVDFSGEASFMSEDYLKMMWRRIRLLQTVLELGYDFVFTDADVMWFRNPFERFYPDGDFQIACDYYRGGSKNENNLPNGGFNYVKSNTRTIRFYDFWYTGQYYFPGKHDQDVLNFIKGNPFISRIGLEVRFLDTALFGGFCEPSKDLDRVITMHANCCFGLDNKIHDIKMVIDDWKRYSSMPIDQRNSTIRSWTVPRKCG